MYISLLIANPLLLAYISVALQKRVPSVIIIIIIVILLLIHIMLCTILI